MVKVKVFIVCITVLIFVFSAIAAYQLYALERSIARSFYTDILDDMQDIGYLDPELAAYYLREMEELGWSVTEDVFAGSSPRNASERARKERQENVTLVVTVYPSRVAQWLHRFLEGEVAFTFAGSRPSEYFDPEW
jgi:hypothetical protein